MIGMKPAQGRSRTYIGYSVQSGKAKTKGHEPVDPFLSKVFDHQKQANKQRRS